MYIVFEDSYDMRFHAVFFNLQDAINYVDAHTDYYLIVSEVSEGRFTDIRSKSLCVYSTEDGPS